MNYEITYRTYQGFWNTEVTTSFASACRIIRTLLGTAHIVVNETGVSTTAAVDEWVKSELVKNFL